MERISLAEVIAALANLAPAQREGLLGSRHSEPPGDDPPVASVGEGYSSTLIKTGSGCSTSPNSA